ncbi:MAG: lysozyme inhibitor LprI family protein [Acidobacteriaceae bacterium]
MRLLAIVLVLASSSCLAQESAQYRACNEKANSQFEIHVCASDEAARADADLNRIYRKLLLLAAKKHGAVAKVKAAQRAWIVYRDSYIDAMYPANDKQAEYGSFFTTDVNNLSAKLTYQQIAALKEMVRQYDWGEP